MRTFIILLLLLTYCWCQRKQTGCPANCFQCSTDAADTNCYICASGYNFALGAPLACILTTLTNCFIDDGNGKCLQCNNRYKLTNNVCSPQPQYNGCTIYFPDGTCTDCGQGMILTTQNTCVGVLNCFDTTSYDLQNNCVKCSLNFNSMQNMCFQKTDTTTSPCLTAGTAASNGVCSQCRTNFQLNAYQCIRTALLTVSNCLVYNTWDFATPKCIQCVRSYKLSETSTCVPLLPADLTASGLENCDTGFNGICFKCKATFIMYQGVCKPSNRVKVNCPAGCAQCSTDLTICYICAVNFVHVPGPLLACAAKTIDNCLFENANHVCLLCKPFFVLTNQKCVQDVSGCILHENSDQTVCTACGGTTTLSGTGCTGIVNCDTYDPISKTCTTCLVNFLKVGNVCSDQVSNNCATQPGTDNNGVCPACKADYTLNGFQCQLTTNFPDNCLFFTPSTKKCKLCTFSYMVDSNGKCRPNNDVATTGNNIPNCDKAFLFICLSCKTGFKLEANQCTQIIRSLDCNQHCSECSFDKSICYFCAPTFVIIPGMSCVVQTVLNCYLQDGFTNCLICKRLYILKAGKCVMDVSGCVLYDSFNNCQRCGGNTELQGTDCVGTINCLGYPYTEGIASRKCNACLPNMLLDQTTFKCTDTIADHCKTNTVASQANGVCPECAREYQINNFICVQKSTFPYKCQLFDTTVTSKACIVCIETYEPTSGVCKANVNAFSTQTGIVNCTLSVRSFCLQCNSDCDLVGNTCVYRSRSTICTIQNCAQCSIDGKLCYICKTNFIHLANSPLTCIRQTIDLCSFQNNEGNCIACRYPYALTNNQCKIDFTGCLLYNYFGMCVICGGNTVYQDGACIGTLNCLSYKYGTTICTKCLPYFTLNSGTGLCMAPIAGCFGNPTSDTKGVCPSCMINYKWNNYKCVLSTSIPPHCLQIDFSTNQCTMCQFSYRMTSNGVCVPNNDPVSDNGVPYCALAYLTICLKCSNRFTMIKTICILDGVPPILNCKVQTNNKCDQCKLRYSLSNDKLSCNPLPDGCLQGNTAECLLCDTGYGLDRVSKQCIVKALPVNCKTVVNQVCKQCQPNYSLSLVTYTCDIIPLPSNCASGYVGYCAFCVQQFYINYPTNECLPLPSWCLFGVSSVCLLCNVGYYFLAGSSVCVAYSLPANCASGVGSVCLLCNNGYTLMPEKDVCALNLPSNCKQGTNGRCSACNDGYGLNTQSNTCVTLPQGCKTGTGQAICTQCYNGYNYNPLANTCTINLPSNCKQGTNGRCSACNDGYGLNAQSNTCVPLPLGCKIGIWTGGCFVCYDDYQLNTASSACSLKSAVVIVNCLIMSNIQGKCQKCIQGYLPDQNGQCASLGICSGYDSISGACIACPSGYMISGVRCVIKPIISIPNCLAVNSNNVCIRCQMTFITVNGGCLSSTTVCGSVNADGTACTSCNNGKVLVLGYCYTPISGPDLYCMQYEVTSYQLLTAQCKTCVSRRYIYNGLCLQTSPYCTDFDSINNTCRACSGGRMPYLYTCLNI